MKTKSYISISLISILIFSLTVLYSLPASALPEYIILCTRGTNQGMYYNPATGTYCIDCIQSNETCFCIILYIEPGGNTAAPGQSGEFGVPVGSLNTEGTQEFISWDFSTDDEGNTHYVFRQ